MNDLKTFQYVLTIAEMGSITDAADTLGIAQSALSRYILKTEKNLGIELFDRTSLPITLTEAGRLFVEAGRKILDINHQLEKNIEEYKVYKNQELKVGVGPSRAPDLIPLILSEFSKDNPEIIVRIDEHRTAELAKRLQEGKEDMIITFLNQETIAFEMEELFQETVVLAVPDRFRKEVESAIHRGKVNLKEIAVPFVSLHEGRQLRTALTILTGGVKPAYDCDYMESAMSLVCHGLGVALVPSYWKMIGKDDSIRFYPIQIPGKLNAEEENQLQKIINRKIGIFYRKEQFLSVAEKAFIDAAKRVCLNI